MKFKNAIVNINSRMNQAETRIYRLEDRNCEVTQLEENNNKNKKEERICDLPDTIKRSNM